MDKKQNLTSFQELTTTELNQITGGGLWEDILYSLNIIGSLSTVVG
ncbi:quorum-sensing system pheromone BlpC [Streptococcus pneumoniae]|nr:quorum-sensing system pheromone BlpC [Streptococcus pneumoniae]